MPKFYFTYSRDHHFYHGGWTEVIAPNEHLARKACAEFHPARNGFIPCAAIYNEEVFQKTIMARDGNFGHRCWETIIHGVEEVTA